MTCRHHDDSNLLAELGAEPDTHHEPCPECSRRLLGYRRVVTWIAEGRTDHRPSAEWRRRTLAQVRATPIPIPSPRPTASEVTTAEVRRAWPEAENASGDRPSSAHESVPESGTATAERAVTKPELVAGAAMPPRNVRPRTRPLLAAFTLTSAAVIAVMLAAVSPRSKDTVEPTALGSRSPSSTATEATRPEPAHAVVGPSRNPSEPPVSAAPTDLASEHRGASAFVDWGAPSAESPPSPVDAAQVPLAPATIEIDTVPRGAQVLLDGVVLGTTPYHGVIPRSERAIKLVVRLAGYLDETVAVGAAPPVTQRIELIPIDPAIPNRRLGPP